MGFGGGFGRAVAGGLQGYAASGNYYGAAAGAAAGFLNKPPKASGGSDQSTPKAPQQPKDQDSFKRQTLDGAPNYLMTSGGLNSAMTPVQQRAQIATQGTSGEASAYRDPEVIDYYRRLAVNSLTDKSGRASGDVLPIEREYLQHVLGQVPRNESTQSFLSALLRA